MNDPALDAITYLATLLALIAIIGIVVKLAIRWIFRPPSVSRSSVSIGRSLAGQAQDENIERLWSRHNASLVDLELQYVEYEADPWSAFRRPLLADVGVPETAAFHQALRHAQDLRTDVAPTTRSQVDEYGTAVYAAHMAWKLADQHARDIAVPTTTDSERRRLRQAEEALRIALDERSSIHERRIALARVETLIKGLTRIEPAARTKLFLALDHEDRKEITS